MNCLAAVDLALDCSWRAKAMYLVKVRGTVTNPRKRDSWCPYIYGAEERNFLVDA